MKRSPLSGEEFRRILDDHEPHDFGIVLNFGLISRKTITLRKDGRFTVENHVDETTQILTSQEIQEEALTNIGKAIRKKALISLD